MINSKYTIFFSDVNECVSGKHMCEQESTICNNSLGSYTCHCKDGYEAMHKSIYKCQGKLQNPTYGNMTARPKLSFPETF